MKTASIVFAVIALILATVQALSIGTNAERMARGLPPRAPRKLFREPSPTTPAKRAKPSSSPGSCSTGPVQCCQEVTTAGNPVAALIIGLLGLVLDPKLVVGLTCSAIDIVSIGGHSCSANTVCCENNSFGGLISIGCVPIVL
ncbi:fungal hydrophobin [Epithele typhae]|uniref:fungal hydrophobin n=1 Tax=Epithele typhae TaxID=378194 RepID=UPI002007B6A6|nr:fungal hydrophobin [Epithele typhae]KAH9944993.1 fungal hydrophobin [Epithele typhae]